MARALGDFSPASTAESELFTFDFVNELRPGDSITGEPDWYCTVAAGVDPDPDARLDGDPTVFSTQVTQRAGGWLPGVQYVMAAVVLTALGDSLELWAMLPGEVVGC